MIYDISTEEELYKLKRRDSFTFRCKCCGENIVVFDFQKRRINSYKLFLCKRCKCRYLHKIHPEWSLLGIEKQKEKYNGKVYTQTKEYIYKVKSTKKEKYGDENYNNRNKAKETSFERYGVDNAMKNKDICEKSMNTNKINHNGFHNMQTEEGKNKCFESNKKNHGGLLYVQTNDFRREVKNHPEWNEKRLENINKSCRYLYGVDFPLQSKDIRDKGKKKYSYDKSMTFDSAWELALWIYAKDHNEDIVREPCFFEFEYGGKSDNKYYPDFLYKGKLIEIKGDHFFEDYNRSKRMICPYSRYSRNTRYFTPEEKKYMDDLYEAKHQCGLKNGVEFWGKEDMKPYMNYIDEKYGLKYLASFKIR